ncbi:MAG: AAA family ATPase [Sulfuricaulis sp.]
MTWINRKDAETSTHGRTAGHADSIPGLAQVGPRQVGKTTLARSLQKQRGNAEYLDLERPSDLSLSSLTPRGGQQQTYPSGIKESVI